MLSPCVGECEGLVVGGDDSCEVAVELSGVDTTILLLSPAIVSLSTILHFNL